MKLPKIDTAIYEMALPSSGKKIHYRAFSVKEEKIFLIAQESKDINQAILAIKQVINNCLVDADIHELAIFDVEYLMLLLRARSVDNTIAFSIKDGETGEKIDLELNLDEVKLQIPENHTKEIRLSEEYVLFMKYPTIEEFAELLRNGSDDVETNYKLMVSCMEKLVSEDSVYMFSDFTQEEIDEFVDDLQSTVVQKIKDFFETLPKLRHEMKYKNKAGAEKIFVIEGMETFFI